MGKEHRILIDYTNHAGARQVREIEPEHPKLWTGLYFGSTEWHPEPQWLLHAYDVGKDDMRTFAVKDIHRWGVEPGRQMDIDLSLARQLQRSMERNARMSNRLQQLAVRAAKTDPSNFSPHDLLLRVTTELPIAIAAILKDEEPTWPPE